MSARARQVYDRIAPWLVLAIGLAAAVGIWVGASATIVNARQDAEDRAQAQVRDEQQKQLLDCFDDFASQLAGGLPPVREATGARDTELGDSMRELRDGLVEVGRDQFDPSDLSALITQINDFLTANDALAGARQDNPYPEPPSTFCATR